MPDPTATAATLAAAQDELSEHMVPWPDDYLEDLSPQAALLVGRQMAMGCMRIVAALLVSEDTGDPEEDPVASRLVNGTSAAIVGLTDALVALEVLPPEALAEAKAALP